LLYQKERGQVRHRLWIGVLLLVCVTGVMRAQTRGLKGVVTDTTGAPVPGAQVTVSNDSGISKLVTTGETGAYLVNGLVPGTYSVKASFPGMQSQPGSATVADAIATLDITLRVTLERQEVTVRETAGPQVSTDASQNASAIVLKDEALDSLSDDPDDLQADLAALAGPAVGPNANQVYIDGFTAGDAVLPNKDAIREIRVNQNPFAPEFDAIGYGRTEILTKPGKDKFRGQVFFNYGSDVFNSRNPYASEKPPFSLEDIGGSVGGPLNHRASFFLDVDRRHIGNGTAIDAVTLDPTTLVPVPFTSVFSAPQSRWRVSPRLDYQFGPNNTLTFRYAISDNSTFNNGAGGFNLLSRAYAQSNLEHAFQLNEAAVLSARVVNEFHFQFLHQHWKQDSPNTNPSIIVSSAFNSGGPANARYQYIHHHYEFQDYATMVEGAHTWKMGIRVRAVSIQDRSAANFDGTYTFGGAYAPILDATNQPVAPGVMCVQSMPSPGCATITSIEQYRRTLLGLPGGGASQFTLNTGNPLVLVGQSDTGLFIGDDWRMRPNLTVSLGLRYETQLNIHGRLDFAPRLGIAWAPGATARAARPKTVLRAGFGIFYYRFNEQNILVAERFNGVTQQQFVFDNPGFFNPNMVTEDEIAKLQQAATAQAVHTVSPLLQAPYVLQSATGIERQIPGNTTISVTYTNSHGLHQLLSRNINAPLPGTYTGEPGSGVFPFPGQGPIYEQESGGLYNQNQVVTNVNSRVNRSLSLYGYYVLSYARSNTDGINTFPANQYSLAGEYGPAMTDIRNRGTIGGTIIAPWDVRLSPLITVQSGAPFDIITSEDVYGDTLLSARPGIPTNPNAPGLIQTPYGLLDPNPAPGEKILPRDFGRGPGLFSVDLRVARTWGIGSLKGPRRAKGGADAAAGGAAPAAPAPGPAGRGGIGGFDNLNSSGGGGSSSERRYSLTASLSARNIFNHTNPGLIIGDINSPLFGQSNQIAGGVGAYSGYSSNRRLEFQLRFGF
jgi:hypothetical protein